MDLWKKTSKYKVPSKFACYFYLLQYHVSDEPSLEPMPSVFLNALRELALAQERAPLSGGGPFLSGAYEVLS
jgi:hypothetical protein